MKYFFDTEFIEDGKTIDLVSIGIAAEDGREFYRCNTEARLDLASGWVREHVLPQLPPYSDHAWRSRSVIRSDLHFFVTNYGKIDLAKDPPEFWAYYADYDWVVFCQLFGTMLDLPKHYPKWCRDLKQLSEFVGSPKHPEQASGEHNALEDARWNRGLYSFLIRERTRLTAEDRARLATP